jgi:hypothetical protein
MYTALLEAPVVDNVPLLLTLPLPPSIDVARALLPEVDTVPVLISELLVCPVLVCPHAAVIPYALGPPVAIEPLLMSVLPLPLAAMPSLKAPVVLIAAPAPLVSMLPFVLPSIVVPRLVPLPPPPLSDSVPLLVMVLFLSTLRTGKGMALVWEALIDAPEPTFIVTPVLPVAATTGVVLLPEQTTVVLLGGAVLLHCAKAGDEKTASTNARMTALIAPYFIAAIVVSPFEGADAIFNQCEFSISQSRAQMLFFSQVLSDANSLLLTPIREQTRYAPAAATGRVRRAIVRGGIFRGGHLVCQL